MIYKNYVGNALDKSLDRQKCMKAFTNCMAEFTMFHVLNYMFNEECEKTFELIEDRGLNKFKVKKLMKTCRSFWKKYYDHLKKNMTKDSWYLLQDYCNVCYGKAEQGFLFLRVALHDFLAKSDTPNRDIISQGFTAQVMAQIIVDTWKLYFKKYQEVCGINFEKDFLYADLTPYMVTFQNMCNLLGDPGYDYMTDTKCYNAYMALKNRINNEDFFDSSAGQALSYSESFSKEYEKELKEIDEERNNRERNALASQLSQKFNVKRL